MGGLYPWPCCDGQLPLLVFPDKLYHLQTNINFYYKNNVDGLPPQKKKKKKNVCLSNLTLSEASISITGGTVIWLAMDSTL